METKKRLPDGIISRHLYRGYRIDIGYDRDPMNPREYDNIGIMVSRDRKFSLDEKIPDYDYDTFEDLMDNVKEGYEALMVLPLMLYEHSGMQLYVGTTGDMWDSRFVGFILTNEKRLQTTGIETRDPEKLEKLLRDEVITYNTYLNGEVYFYETATRNGDPIDSCGGFYNILEALETAKDDINWHINNLIQGHIVRLKKYIKKKVPLIYRKPFTTGL